MQADEFARRFFIAPLPQIQAIGYGDEFTDSFRPIAKSFTCFLKICQRTVLFLLTATVLSAPWLFGSALPLFQFGFAISLCISIWLCLLTSWRAEHHTILGAPVCLLFLAVLLGGAQLIPLSSDLHKSLSSQSLEWWQSLSGTASSSRMYPLSVYPAGTRGDLALLALPAAALVITALKFKRLEVAPWLLGLIAFNGAAFAIFGVVQQLTSPDKLYWSVDLEQGGVPFAAFVNRNHAAAYLNLCLACGLGFLIWVRERPKVGGAFDILDRGTQLILAVLFTAACAAGVILSLSRGGAVASLCAAVALLVLAPRLRQDAGYRNTIISAVTMGLLVAVWLGGGSALGERFQNLRQQSVSTRGRLQHWQDAMHAIPDFWVAGSGLGTYRYAYQPYEQRFVDGWFYHAENQFLEALVEGGLPGLLLVLALMAFVLRRAVRGLRAANSPFGYGVGVACVFGLVATMVHAAADFNLYLPAVSILVALLAGLSLCLPVSPNEPRPAMRRSFVFGIVPLVLMSVWSTWNGWELHRIADIDTTIRSIGEVSTDVRLDPKWVEEKSQQLKQRLQNRPDDAEAQVSYAEFLIAAFHSNLYDQLRIEAETAHDEATLWKIADPLSLHEKYHRHPNPDEFLGALRINPGVRELLQPAFDTLQSASENGPLLARAHTLLARLSFVFEPDASEIEHGQAPCGFADSIQPPCFNWGFWIFLRSAMNGDLNDGESVSMLRASTIELLLAPV